MELTNNDWMYVNNLVLKINSNISNAKMREAALNSLKLKIPNDASTFFVTNECGDLIDPIYVGLPRSIPEKYPSIWQDIDYKKWIFATGKTGVFRTSDLMDSHTFEKQKYYVDVLNKLDLYHEITVSLAYEDEFLGVITLFRSKDRCGFTEHEAELLKMLQEHFAQRLFRDKYLNSSTTESQLLVQAANALAKKHTLTIRETEITQLLVQNVELPCICEQLYISLSTARKHIANIYRKLDVHSHLELLALAKGIPQYDYLKTTNDSERNCRGKE